MIVPLDRQQELRFQRLMDSLVLIDVHQHPQVLTEDMDDLLDYFRSREYAWGYDAVRAGGWTTVCTANVLSTSGFAPDLSYVAFADLVSEIALMLADMTKQGDSVVKIARADDILSARQRGAIGFLPTVEHLAMGAELHHIDVLYGLGVRLAGVTYSRRAITGDGQFERADCGLSDLGIAAVERMNDLGMIVDLSHAGTRTALEAIESGLESPTDGKNIIRGLIARGYEDGAIHKIAGQNALDLFRRVIG